MKVADSLIVAMVDVSIAALGFVCLRLERTAFAGMVTLFAVVPPVSLVGLVLGIRDVIRVWSRRQGIFALLLVALVIAYRLSIGD